jgi:arylsulfatase A-like enzyme
MPKTDRPNIVICQCDQLRACSVGCYGNQEVSTPHIDALAAAGMRCEMMFSNNPVCTPARSCLLSGQYARTCTGMLGNVHEDPPNGRRVRMLDPTLPEVLQQAGYKTALIGKWHVDPQPQLVGFGTAVYPKTAHKHYGQTYFNEKLDACRIEEFGPWYERELVRDFLARRDQQPFFLHYNISPPHQPIGPEHIPPQYHGMFDPQALTLRGNVDPSMLAGRSDRSADPAFWYRVYCDDEFFWDHHYRRPHAPGYDLPEGFGIRHLTALYYAATALVDDLVGDLMASLARENLLDNTLVVFLSDHGDMLGSHGRFNKGQLFEEAIRVPLIYAGTSRVPQHAVTSRLTQTIDVMPTILGLVGLEVPEYVQGRDLTRIWTEPAPQEEAVFIETADAGLGMRTSRNLFAIAREDASADAVGGIYDVATDPFEQVNLAAGGWPSVFAEYRQAIERWDRQTPWCCLGGKPDARADDNTTPALDATGGTEER